MPFVSDKQRKFLFAEKPDVAHKFAKDAKPAPKTSKAIQALKSLKPGLSDKDGDEPHG